MTKQHGGGGGACQYNFPPESLRGMHYRLPEDVKKYTFEQLDPETQEQIIFELCRIGEASKSWGEIADIETAAREWIKENNAPKTADEWQAAVMARDSEKINNQ